jgi:hypothetical protein
MNIGPDDSRDVRILDSRMNESTLSTTSTTVCSER